MPVRLCSVSRCGQLATYRGRCSHHNRERGREVRRNRVIYNSKRWAMTRRAQLTREPLCRECEGAGTVTIATDVDHVVAIEDGGSPWAPGNLQSLCAPCHGRKTAREVRAR